jgi:hypothetical protein
MKSAIAQGAVPMEPKVPDTAPTGMSATEQAAQQYLEFKRQRTAITLAIARQY